MVIGVTWHPKLERSLDNSLFSILRYNYYSLLLLIVVVINTAMRDHLASKLERSLDNSAPHSAA